MSFELLSCRLPHRFTLDSGLATKVFHGDPQISLDSLPDYLTVDGRGNTTLSRLFGMVAFMADLLETLNSISYGVSRTFKQSNNFILVKTLEKQLPKRSKFVRHSRKKTLLEETCKEKLYYSKVRHI